jgi:hypothetical protein
MDADLQARFIALWSRYFPGADLPVAFYYADDSGGVEVAPPAETHRCMVCDLAKVRHGTSLCFDKAGAVCFGAKRYLGFSQELAPNFSYFLSCGIPGKLEGERYKKTPEMVEELMAKAPKFEAPARNIIFKRWDKLEPGDEPAVVIFFATADVLSGLFTLSGFATADHLAVIAPFAAGCGSIVQYPYLEMKAENPRAVLGMFDVSARPCVPADVLTIAIPMPKFERMVADMEESFLITESWDKVRSRIAPNP